MIVGNIGTQVIKVWDLRWGC